MNRSRWPAGARNPCRAAMFFPQSWRLGVDSLLGLSLPQGENPAVTDDALALIQSVLVSSSEKVNILTLGPLTNLGELFLNEESFQSKIKRIYIMGGAVHVPGNIFSGEINNKSAEWNIYVDPAAAQIVFDSGLPITLIPLDATNQAPLTSRFYTRLKNDRQSSEADFIYEVLSKNQGMITSGSYYFWDPLAAALLVDESLSKYEDQPLCVVQEEGPNSGQTLVGEGCPVLQVAVDADQTAFENVFVEVLNYP